MKKLLILFVLLFFLIPGQITYAETFGNWVSCTVGTNTLDIGKGEDATFTCVKVTNTADFPACSNGAPCRIAVMTSTCEDYALCAAREILTVKSASCVTGTCTLTIKARGLEGTSAATWAEESKVDMLATAAQGAKWEEAYGWGNHALIGYLTSETSHSDVLVDGDFTSQGLMKRGASGGSYSIVTDNSSNWNTAYDWGNHALLTTHIAQSETCVNTGDGAAGALTITPTSNIIKLTNNDSDGCVITMSETGMVDGMRVEIWNISTNSATIANSAGVQEVNADGTITIGEWQKAILLYSTDTWVVTQ